MSRISIQPGVDFAMKGYKVSVSEGDVKVNGSQSLYYVDIPVLANFGFDLGNDLGVFVNAGPYLGIGVAGKSNGKVGKLSLDVDKNPFDKDNGILNRIDWGAQVGAGVEYNHFQVGVGTQFGIGDIRNDNWKKANDKAIRNSNFFVTVGYRF